MYVRSMYYIYELLGVRCKLIRPIVSGDQMDKRRYKCNLGPLINRKDKLLLACKKW